MRNKHLRFEKEITVSRHNYSLNILTTLSPLKMLFLKEIVKLIKLVGNAITEKGLLLWKK
jgi:hypothetical protein